MATLLERLDEIILVVLFVLLPILQRAFAHLQRKRAQATQSERARRALEDPPAPEPAEPEERGRDLWRELLSQMEEAAEAPPAPAPPPPAPAAPPKMPAKAKPPAPALARPLTRFEPESLGGLPPVPSEDELEGPRAAPRAPLAELQTLDVHEAVEPLFELQTLDVHEAVEPLAELHGLVSDLAPRAPDAAPRTARAGVDWRRAVVLSEVLHPPVALRDPGGLAPGLAGLV